MDDLEITEDEIKKCNQELESGKAAGPDKLKPELYEEIGKSQICLGTLNSCFHKIIDRGTPKSWLTSLTNGAKNK